MNSRSLNIKWKSIHRDNLILVFKQSEGLLETITKEFDQAKAWTPNGVGGFERKSPLIRDVKTKDGLHIFLLAYMPNSPVVHTVSFLADVHPYIKVYRPIFSLKIKSYEWGGLKLVDLVRSRLAMREIIK